MRSRSTLLYLAAALTLNCAGQDAKSTADPVADTSGLPVYLKLLPKPEIEPWTKITGEQRWQQYVSLTYSPLAVLGAAAGAGVSQAIDSPTEWGQGAEGYGKRVASSYASTLVGNTVTFGSAALFHDDNRYFRSHSGGFFARLGHVIASPYVARNDQGGKRFSTSQFLGSAAYSGIQLAWQPRSWQGWDDVAINYSIWYGTVAGVNLFREFYPSFVKKFRKSHP